MTDTIIVSGDWFYEGGYDGDGRYTVAFEAQAGATWNGWQTPIVTRGVAEEIVKAQDAFLGEEAGDRLSWDGDVLVFSGEPEMRSDEVYTERVSPTHDGRYVMGFGWCWDRVDPGDCRIDRLVREVAS